MMPARTSGCVIASSTTTAPELEATLPAAMSLAAASSERASCMVGGVTDPLFDLYRYSTGGATIDTGYTMEGLIWFSTRVGFRQLVIDGDADGRGHGRVERAAWRRSQRGSESREEAARCPEGARSV